MTATGADVHELRHGYNLADLDRLARIATRRAFGPVLDGRDRYQVAWSAIAEQLYAAAARPDPAGLLAAARGAISTHQWKDLHHRGLSLSYQGTPRHAAYWHTMSAPTPSPEAAVVDRAALWQIWPRLTAGERAALHALAVYGTHAAAADALGLAYGTFAARLRRARARFLTLWHEGEQPSRLWRIEMPAHRGTRTPPALTRGRITRYAALRAEGLTHRQIAARMGLSPAAVYRIAAQHRAEQGQ
jgi:DNA-directed RNA polymerase specialized sigma24 family protein